MSEENEALVRLYFEEIWDKGNLDLIDELFTTNLVRHGPVGTEGGEVRGLEGFKGLVSSYRTGLPDLRIPIEDLIAEGDRVVTRWTAHGTHQGELLGNAPTGNQATDRRGDGAGTVGEPGSHVDQRHRELLRTPLRE